MKGASGPRLCHPFAGAGERGSSIRSPTRERVPPLSKRRANDEKRPSNRQRSRGIHPEGFGRRSTGKPGRAMLTRTRLAEIRKGPSHPRKGAISGGPSREMGNESAQAFRSPRVASTARPFTWSGGVTRGEVEGDARSSGVPTNIVECKKPREQGRRIRAKDLLHPSSTDRQAFGHGEPRLGISKWKSRGRGDLRLETGITYPLPA